MEIFHVVGKWPEASKSPVVDAETAKSPCIKVIRNSEAEWAVRRITHIARKQKMERDARERWFCGRALGPPMPRHERDERAREQGVQRMKDLVKKWGSGEGMILGTALLRAGFPYDCAKRCVEFAGGYVK